AAAVGRAPASVGRGRTLRYPLGRTGAWPNGMAPDSGSGGSRFESWRASHLPDQPTNGLRDHPGPFSIHGAAARKRSTLLVPCSHVPGPRASFTRSRSGAGTATGVLAGDKMASDAAARSGSTFPEVMPQPDYPGPPQSGPVAAVTRRVDQPATP